MSVALLISMTFTTIFDVFLYYLACGNFFEKRSEHNLLRYSLVVLLFVAMVALVLLQKNLFLKISLVFILVNIMMNLFFRAKTIKIAIVVICVSALMLVTEVVIMLLLGLQGEQYKQFVLQADKVFTLNLLSKVIEFIVIVSIGKKLNLRSELANRQWLNFVFMLAIVMVALISYVLPENRNLIPVNYLIPAILIIISFVIYFNLIDLLHMGENLRIKSINEERMKAELNLWHQLEEKDELQKKLLHDYDNTMIVINGLLAENKVGELKTYMEDLSYKHKLAHSAIKTGNSLLDVLINNKYEKSQSNGINLVLKLTKLEDCPLKSDDLIIIIGNLLDNAIEYCMQDKVLNKVIHFNIEHSDDEFSILVRNPLLDKLDVRKNLIKSSKKAKNHGIGMSNVKAVVESYGGEIVIDTSGGYFTYLIIIS